jgi:hypothetical protein
MALKRNFVLAIALIGATLAPALANAAIGTGSFVDVSRSNSGTATAGYANGDPTYGGSTSYGGSNTGGGEFRITELGGGTEVFKTFCLEYNEHISIGGDYQVTINNGAIMGGGGTTIPGPFGTTLDKLSDATVFMYSAYRTNNLNTWAFGNPAIGSFVYDSGLWADALQLAIWRAEFEMGAGYLGLGSTAYDPDGPGGINTTVAAMADALYNYASNPLNQPLIADPNVKVLNLWNGVGNMYNPLYAAQSQLYWGTANAEVEGVPEPASLVIWGAGLGIAGLVAARRRKMAKA